MFCMCVIENIRMSKGSSIAILVAPKSVKSQTTNKEAS
jgi:hypothetical protein